jgi:hypothetical protein
MHRPGKRKSALWILLSVGIAALSLSAGVQAQEPDKVLDLEDLISGVPKLEPIDPDNVWHELYPDDSLFWEQIDYDLQGHTGPDMQVGDYIRLSDDNWYSITWLGPSYYLIRNGELSIYEPTDLGAVGGDPTGQQWLRVNPDHGTVVTVDGWTSEDELFGVYDSVTIDGGSYLLVKIGFAINADYDADPIGYEDRTWGDVKSLFRY